MDEAKAARTRTRKPRCVKRTIAIGYTLEAKRGKQYYKCTVQELDETSARVL